MCNKVEASEQKNHLLKEKDRSKRPLGKHCIGEEKKERQRRGRRCALKERISAAMGHMAGRPSRVGITGEAVGASMAGQALRSGEIPIGASACVNTCSLSGDAGEGWISRRFLSGSPSSRCA